MLDEGLRARPTNDEIRDGTQRLDEAAVSREAPVSREAGVSDSRVHRVAGVRVRRR
jgi:hypothetical protein